MNNGELGRTVAAGEAATVRNRPAAAEPREIAIEALLVWAVAQAPAPRLRVAAARELTLNPYDVHVKGADNRFHGTGMLVEGGRCGHDIDAGRVLQAVDRLDPWARSLVLVNARAAGRPDWMPGVAPRLVAVRRRCRRKHRAVVKGHRWEPCSPQAICAAREIYGRWQAALAVLRGRLDGRLIAFVLNDILPPPAPWLPELEKAA